MRIFIELDAQQSTVGVQVVVSPFMSSRGLHRRSQAGESLLRDSQIGDCKQHNEQTKSQWLSQPTPQTLVPGRTLQQLTVVMACLCWIAASSGAILVNKHIMVDLNFPYPSTVAAIGMVGTSLVTFIIVRILRLVPATQKVSLKFL
eukprot:GHRR01015394.1.p1 GENE.GHRR01015394.1~~GHRR01015394.1.p1  ORF type:complete len:146 (+),score=21.24 GHRR01015394.1:161-598(+)